MSRSNIENTEDQKQSTKDFILKLGNKKPTIEIVSESPTEEFELDLRQILSEWPTYKKLNPGKTYDDFLEENGLLLSLSNGGIVDLSGSKLEDLKATFRSLMGREPKNAKELIRIIKLDLKGMDSKGVPYGAF
jgi:hypothetical protein